MSIAAVIASAGVIHSHRGWSGGGQGPRRPWPWAVICAVIVALTALTMLVGMFVKAIN